MARKNKWFDAGKFKEELTSQLPASVLEMFRLQVGFIQKNHWEYRCILDIEPKSEMYMSQLLFISHLVATLIVKLKAEDGSLTLRIYDIDSDLGRYTVNITPNNEQWEKEVVQILEGSNMKHVKFFLDADFTRY